LLNISIDSLQNVLCSGGSQGAIYISVLGGTAPYQYQWSNGATTQDITNLPAGTYNVSVLDSKGCFSSAGATITQPLPLFLNIATYHNLSCYNDSTGSIFATANGGVPPYTYAWSDGQTTQDIYGLHAGAYSLTVVDANGCIQTISQTISEPNQLSSGVSTTNVTCHGSSNGSVDLTVNGGTSPYTYLWSNGAVSEDLSNIPGGNYSVVIYDANGCSATNIATVAEPAAITISDSVVNVLCNGASTGAVYVTVNGGTNPISYLWSNGSTSQNITAVAAGSYSVVITDGNLCTAYTSVNITQPAGLLLNATPVSVTCAGGNNGSVALTVNGGVFPYAYLWSNGATTQNINGLNGGSYSVVVTDANGCTIGGSYVIGEPSPLTSSVTGTDVTCHGQANGTATLNVGGGTAPYSYLWSNFQATQNLTGLNGGTYYVIITDANGCTKRDSVIINEPAAITISDSVVNVLCNNGTTGAVYVTVNGGTNPVSYLWSNGSTNQNLTGVGAGNYSLIITDVNACTAALSASVTQPTAMVLNATPVSVGCAGGNNGSIALTVNGGVFPYSYLWNNGATTQNINGLNGGTYSVQVTDANGCVITASYIINEPLPLTSSVAGTNVRCHGGANGTATLTVSGGTAPYTFLWSNFQATQNLSGLGGGTYYVIITDAHGCTKRDSVIITEPAAITLTDSVNNVSCNGGTDGSVYITVNGGTNPISYSWSNGATTKNLTGVGVGSYTVVITDGNLCNASLTAAITQPTALVLSASTTNVGCAGGANGSISVVVNGGVFPYLYTWSNGDSTQNVNGLSGGNYTLTVTDANGCILVRSFNITEPSPITATISGTDVSCFGASDGSASVSPAGGTAPYSYLWSNFQGSSSIQNLVGGLYYVIITDANGCQLKDSILVKEAPALVLSTTVLNITCFNAHDGAINLTVTGGTPGYTYAWSDGETTANISNLGDATYVVVVTDAHHCSASASAVVVNPSAIGDNFVVQTPLCYGDTNGYINLIPSGGNPPYTFKWNTGAVTEDLVNIGVGDYVVTITDSRGCSKVDSAHVPGPSQLFTSGVIKNVTCFGYNDGAVQITAYGGTLPYNYVWSTGSTTQDIFNVSGSNYFVTVSDVNGCQAVSLYIVREPSQLTVGLSGKNVSCFGGNDGAIAALPAGGTTPYSYIWRDVSTDSARVGLTAGLYGLQLVDSNGCSAFDSLLITQPTPISISGSVTNVICFNSATGAVDITVTGGTPGYSYTWSNGPASEDINTIPAGNYIVTVTDGNSCQSTASFDVLQGPQMFANLGTYDPVCHGGNSGSVTAIVTGGYQPYSYLWSTAPADTTISANHLYAGTYTVTVTDSKNCTVTGSATLNQPAAIVVSATSFGAKCFNTATGMVVASVTGGVPPYTYLLNGNAQSTDTFAHLAPGHYMVIVTDVNGCQGTDSFTVLAPGQLGVTLTTTDQVILSGMKTQLSATVTPAGTGVQYIWSPITIDSVDVFDYSSCADTSNCSVPYVRPPFTQTFTVTVMNSDSCFVSDTVTVYVKNELSAFIPSAFTPNGDGLNDRFTFDILGATTIEVAIFDRWGERIYYDAAQPNGISSTYGWDGTKSGKPAPEDTYVYQMKVTYFDGKIKDRTGTVTLMR
jgi:gliding motility-associated-like protein